MRPNISHTQETMEYYISTTAPSRDLILSSTAYVVDLPYMQFLGSFTVFVLTIFFVVHGENGFLRQCFRAGRNSHPMRRPHCVSRTALPFCVWPKNDGASSCPANETHLISVSITRIHAASAHSLTSSHPVFAQECFEAEKGKNMGFISFQY